MERFGFLAAHETGEGVEKVSPRDPRAPAASAFGWGVTL